jgi:hypothetical protein
MSPKRPVNAGIVDALVAASASICGFSLYFSLLARNLVWRPVRYRLPPQPASPVSKYFRYDVAEKPAVGGLLASGRESLCSESGGSSDSLTKSFCSISRKDAAAVAASLRPARISIFLRRIFSIAIAADTPDAQLLRNSRSQPGDSPAAIVDAILSRVVILTIEIPHRSISRAYN